MGRQLLCQQQSSFWWRVLEWKDGWENGGQRRLILPLPSTRTHSAWPSFSKGFWNVVSPVSQAAQIHILKCPCIWGCVRLELVQLLLLQGQGNMNFNACLQHWQLKDHRILAIHCRQELPPRTFLRSVSRVWIHRKYLSTVQGINRYF